MDITGEQIGAGIALAKVDRKDLLRHVGISQSTLSHIETGKTKNPKVNIINRIVEYIAARGVEFHAGGVRPIPDTEVVTLLGTTGFRALMDSLYGYVKNNKGAQINICNGVPSLFIKWLGQDWYNTHSERMFNIKDNFGFKILVSKQDSRPIAKGFAEYRIAPEDQFSNQTVYIFGDHVAVFTFSDENVTINLLKGVGLAALLRSAFDASWEKAA